MVCFSHGLIIYNVLILSYLNLNVKTINDEKIVMNIVEK